ncbi:MAG: cytochrome c biogenesis protein CcdA, partial [Pseudomonadota bacterium]
PDHITGDSATIDATITWLVCSDICVPETTHAQLVIPFAKNGQEPKATNATLFDAARKALPENVAWQGLIEEEDQNLILNFKTDSDTVAALAKAKDMYFYAADWGIILYAAPQTISVKDDTLTLRLQRDSRALSDLTSLKGVFQYTTENNEQKSVSIEVPIMGKSPAVSGADATLAPSSEVPTTFIQALFLAFLGGIILNLMPCVFPVLSMKALSLIKMSAREQKHAILHGFIYTAGIQLCFLGIAGLLIALQATGEKIGWGFQLQNPAVVLLLAYLLFIMGLNLSGFFEFKSGFLSNLGHKMTMKHGYVGTFFTGVLATIVATPCTAPFMGAAMGYALTQPAALSLSVFAALGFGLAAPY